MSATSPTAIDGFAAAIGPDKVFTDEATLREYRDPFQHESSDAYSASAVLMPETLEEIQAILCVANDTGTSLWTHGQGRNNGYGGGAPVVLGSAVVSLRNMNRVWRSTRSWGTRWWSPGCGGSICTRRSGRAGTS